VKKKVFIMGAIFLGASAQAAFCGATDGLASAAYNAFDSPLIDGIAYFMSAAGTFTDMAAKLATVLGVVCVVWNAFKLWMGTEQVKKACADIITKFLIFTAAFTLYPKVVNGTINLAINIGATAGAGTTDILEAFGKLYASCYEKVLAAQVMVDDFVKNGYFSSDVLNEQTLKKIADMGGSTLNLDARMAQFEDPPVNSEGWRDGQFMGNGAETAGAAAMRNQARAEEAQRRAAELLKQYKEGGVEQAMVILKTMAEVFRSEIRYYHHSGGAPTEYKHYFYDPFIKNEGGKYKQLISPGSMIKTAVVIAQVISTKESVFYEEEESEGKDKKSGSFIEKAVNNTIQSLLHSLLVLLMSLGVIASAVFFTIQYVMCVFEYFIVSTIGIIFIPFCLWDGTKSFTAKLVTLFSAYFIKILVMMFCVFWVFAAYLRMGNNIISDPNGVTLLNFSYFLFTVLLGWVVTQNAPQIALAMLNGSPQLSMGEFMHAAGTAAAAGLAAHKMAQTGGKTLQAGGKGVQAVGRGVQNARLALAADKSGTSSLGSTVKSGIANSMSKMLTGREAEGHKKGFSLGATGDDGKAITMAEAMRRAQGEPAGQSGPPPAAEKADLGAAKNAKNKEDADKTAKQAPEPDGGGKPNDNKPLVVS
jgi:type IV secretion system protein TrbL